MKKIGFGGGCHWCTEAIFQSLNGVVFVEQGWIASELPYDSFSEGVIVHYSDDISLEILVEVHLHTHSSTSNHSMRQKYRSAVYYFDKEDEVSLNAIIECLAHENNKVYITHILPYLDFKLNKEDYLNYYKNNKQRPFCQSYIIPKLSMIREKYRRIVRDDF